MSKFILIETATNACSIAIAINGKIVSERQITEQKAHAQKLAPFIKEAVKESGISSIQEFSAISVSEGPGSYTGLRVGVSTAKGLCFGADLPLIGICTLDILAEMAVDMLTKESANSPIETEANKIQREDEDTLIIPMLDARRMEVYCANYNNKAEKLSDTIALVLDETSFAEEFKKYTTIIFIGDGAEKFKTCLDEKSLNKSIFINTYPSASHMLFPTLKAWKKNDLQDTAYFEPTYLKEFQAGISKKKIL